jgi:hypothetical protein
VQAVEDVRIYADGYTITGSPFRRRGNVTTSGLGGIGMTSSLTPSPAFASERVAELNDQPTYTHETSSPQRSSSHDEYNPPFDNTSPKTPPPVSDARSASHVYTTPSCRSSTAVSQSIRDALDDLYERVYGPNSRRCLVTQNSLEKVLLPLILSVVEIMYGSPMVSPMEYDLDTPLAFSLRVLPRMQVAYLQRQQ